MLIPASFLKMIDHFFQIRAWWHLIFGVYEKDPFTILKNYVIQNLYVSQIFFRTKILLKKK